MEAESEMIMSAIAAASNAYAPYSNFHVGAALRTRSGKTYTGCNVENASFGLTNCAERTALFKAVSEGERAFDALVIAADKAASPCGACRQALAEFCPPDLPILCVDLTGQVALRATLGELLPATFTL